MQWLFPVKPRTDDLDAPTPEVLQRVFQFVACVAAIREDVTEEREQTEKLADQQHRAARS
jgi:hypothetical protein